MTETVEYGLDIRQQLVLEEQRQLLSALQGFNDELDHKATRLRQAGLFTAALVIALGISGFTGIPLGVAAAVSILIIILTTETLSPQDHQLPGATDWGEIESDYLLVDAEICFQHIWSDIFGAMETTKVINKSKARAVIWAGRLLWLQVMGILVFVLMVVR